MRYRFIESHDRDYPVRWMCRRLEVSSSGYYDWRGREPSAHALRDTQLSESIREVFGEHQARYGAPRVCRQLKEQGMLTSQKRVARLMKEQQLCAVVRKKRPKTTQTDSSHPKAANHLARDFCARTPNQKWVGDITYVPTHQGWLFLAVLLDLFSRKVIGYQMSSRIDTQLALDALKTAIEARGLPEGLVHHSDRGCQYTSASYQARLAGCTISMSRKGNCWDNAVAESFFATLEKELLMKREFQTKEEANIAIFEYIEIYYNKKRMHSSIDYHTPTAFEARHAA